MNIAGLQKMTLLDYPGKVACTVFLPGCNFRCPFCHNSELLGGGGEAVMTDAELLAFLKKRQGILEGVCITGGEPTLQKELPDLLRRIKELGYPVKLDTNGYRPQVLQALVEEGLVDYVAMDVKNGPDAYAETAGVPLELSRIEQSLAFLLEGKVDYELRTTVVHPLHSAASIQDMAQWLEKLQGKSKFRKLFLQSFVDRDTVLFSGLEAPGDEKLEEYREILGNSAETVQIRGK